MTWEDSDGDKGKLQKVLGYLEKSLDVSKANNFPNGCIRVRGFIEEVKSEINECDSEENLVCQKQIYEQTSKEFGESSPNAIQTGLKYADTLKRLHQGVKSEQLVYKLNDISHRSHGADHVITKAVGYRKDSYMCRAVSISGDYQSSRALSFREYNQGPVRASHYLFIEYDGCFEKCTVKDGQKTLSLSTDNIIFALGTPVVCHDKNSDISTDLGDRIYCEETESYTIRNVIGENGVPRLGDIRSWNIETQCYTIYWEDESFEPRIVHRSKVIVPSSFGNDCIVIPIQADICMYTG